MSVKAKWWPYDYEDEVMPEGRKTPTHWLRRVGKYHIELCDAFDDEEDEGKGTPLKDGQLEKFVYRIEHGCIDVDVCGDGTFEVVNGNAPRGANHFSDGDENICPTLQDWVDHELINDPLSENERRVCSVDVAYWAAAIPFRYSVDVPFLGTCFLACMPDNSDVALEGDALRELIRDVMHEDAPQKSTRSIDRQEHSPMHCTFTDTQDLVSAFEILAATGERRNTIPILSNVEIEASRDRVCFTATDLDIQTTIEVPGNIATTGTLTAPLGYLRSALKQFLPESGLILKTDQDGGLDILTAATSLNLPTLPAIDFPEMVFNKPLHCFKISAFQLATAFKIVRHAISIEEARFYLNGVFLTPFEDKLRMVTTDGHRLALHDTGIAAGTLKSGVLIPRKTVDVVRAGIDQMRDPATEITIELTETKIRFTWPRHDVVSKLIEGTFPDYTRVIPKHASELSLSTKAMHDALGRVAAMSRERGLCVRVKPDGHLRLRLSLNRPGEFDISTFVEVMDCSGDLPPEIGFNISFLAEIFAIARGQQFTERVPAILEIGDAASRINIRFEGLANTQFTLMPMRI